MTYLGSYPSDSPPLFGLPDQSVEEAEASHPTEEDFRDTYERLSAIPLLEEPLSHLLFFQEGEPGYTDAHRTVQRLVFDNHIAERMQQEEVDIAELVSRWGVCHDALFYQGTHSFPARLISYRMFSEWRKYVYPSDHPLYEVDDLTWVNVMIRRIPEFYEKFNPILTGGRFIDGFVDWPVHQSQFIYGGGGREERAVTKYWDFELLKPREVLRVIKASPVPEWMKREYRPER